MADHVADLFAEYASAYVRGEEPRAQEYLERAGEETEELARLLDAFVAAAPRPTASADSVALVSAWAEGEPPLVHVRASRGVRVEDVVDAIVEEAGLAASSRAKVKRYYQQLEQGFLAPSGVSERVWAVLRRLIGPAAEAAASWRAQPAAADAAYFRAAAPVAEAAPMTAEEPDSVRDEVDALFTNGR
jgi:hypothetical protein